MTLAMLKRGALLLCVPMAVMAAPGAQAPLADTLDGMTAARFKPELPGVAALVLKDGKPIPPERTRPLWCRRI